MKFLPLLVFSLGLFYSCESLDYEEPSEDQWVNFTTKDYLGSNIVWSIEVLNDTSIWAGTQHGVYVNRGEGFRLFQYIDVIAYSMQKMEDSLLIASNLGCFWVCEAMIPLTSDQFFYNDVLFDGKYYWLASKRHGGYIQNGRFYNDEINKLLHSSDSVVWVATKFDGIYGYKNYLEEFHFDSVNGLGSNHCLTVFEDSKNTIWVGTNSENGLNQILQDTVVNFAFPQIQAICEDQEGNLWLGSTTYGVYKWETDGNIIHYTLLDGLPSNRITDMTIDPLNRVWIATEDAGIAYYQEN